MELTATEIVQAISEMSKGMMEIGKSIEGMAEKIAAPKKLIRDANGNIIGAQPVGKL